MEQYFIPLFNPETSVAMVVCGPGQRDEIVKGLEEEGFEVETTEMDDKVPWADDCDLQENTSNVEANAQGDS
jgi:uroporphyrinogen-III synthase